MIEIILAIAIIAIGISSVMVLFTSGLKMGRQAVQRNNSSNFSESLIAHVRTAVMMYSQRSGDDVSSGWGADYFDKISAKPWSDTEGVGLSDFDLSSDQPIIFSSTKKSFLYRQIAKRDGVDVIEFSAVAEVRLVDSNDADIVIVSPNDGTTVVTLDKENKTAPLNSFDSDGLEAFSRARRVVEVRISYPADSAFTAREKFIYRLEVFNNKYDRFVL